MFLKIWCAFSRYSISYLEMKTIRIYMALLLCLAASCALGEGVYLLSLDWTVSPFDGSDPYRHRAMSAPLWVSSPDRKVSVPACSGRYACEVFIAEAEGSKGRLAVSITEYDSPDTPSKIVSEIDTTVGFSLEELGVFEAQTASALVRLEFLVLPGPEGSTKASILEKTVYGIGENHIRAVHYFSDGGFVGARVYPGANVDKLVELGLMPGDIVVSFNERKAVELGFVDDLQTSLRAGQVTSLLVLRDGDLVEIQID